MFEDLKIGIIGGSQLAATLSLYARNLGMDIKVLGTGTASQSESVVCPGDPCNYEDVIAFGADMDVVSVRSEQANTDALRWLRDRGVRVYPSPEVLDVIQDRSLQRYRLRDSNIPVATGWLVAENGATPEYSEEQSGASQIISRYRYNSVLKMQTAEDVSWMADKRNLLEDVVDVTRQVSVLVARSEAGVVECFDPVHMVFNKERMLIDFEISSGDYHQDTLVKIGTIARQVAESIDLTGMMTIEMLLAANGKIYVDELKLNPEHGARPASCTAFEQQIRKALDLPQGTPQGAAYVGSLSIPEPGAHRKQTLSDTLKSVLCTSDIHLYQCGEQSDMDRCNRYRKAIANISREAAASKAILIRHMLRERSYR